MNKIKEWINAISENKKLKKELDEHKKLVSAIKKIVKSDLAREIELFKKNDVNIENADKFYKLIEEGYSQYLKQLAPTSEATVIQYLKANKAFRNIAYGQALENIMYKINLLP